MEHCKQMRQCRLAEHIYLLSNLVNDSASQLKRTRRLIISIPYVICIAMSHPLNDCREEKLAFTSLEKPARYACCRQLSKWHLWCCEDMLASVLDFVFSETWRTMPNVALILTVISKSCSNLWNPPLAAITSRWARNMEGGAMRTSSAQVMGDDGRWWQMMGEDIWPS